VRLSRQSAYRPESEVSVEVGGIEQLVDAVVAYLAIVKKIYEAVFPIPFAHICPTFLPMPIFESHLYDTPLKDVQWLLLVLLVAR